MDLIVGGVFVVTSYLNPPARVPVRPFSRTEMSTAPAIVLAGVFAVMVSAPRTATSVAGRPPIVTAAPAAKPDPRIVNSVPPAAGPMLGLTD